MWLMIGLLTLRVTESCNDECDIFTSYPHMQVRLYRNWLTDWLTEWLEYKNKWTESYVVDHTNSDKGGREGKGRGRWERVDGC